jgi:hypothetical protein
MSDRARPGAQVACENRRHSRDYGEDFRGDLRVGNKRGGVKSARSEHTRINTHLVAHAPPPSSRTERDQKDTADIVGPRALRQVALMRSTAKDRF